SLKLPPIQKRSLDVVGDSQPSECLPQCPPRKKIGIPSRFSKWQPSNCAGSPSERQTWKPTFGTLSNRSRRRSPIWSSASGRRTPLSQFQIAKPEDDGGALTGNTFVAPSQISSPSKRDCRSWLSPFRWLRRAPWLR